MIPLPWAAVSASRIASTCGATSSKGRAPARATRSATEPPSASSMVYHETSPRASQS